jgi:hypothetical protein
MTLKLSKDRKKTVNAIDKIACRRYTTIFPDAKKSSDTEDMYDHIDFWHVRDGERFGVDIKGNKLPNELWIEFQNVNGDPGWLYGKAKWIAFEIPEISGFAMVERQHLKAWAEFNIDIEDKVENPMYAYKKVYTRSAWSAYDGKPQRDLISKITLHDLREVAGFKIAKYKSEYWHPEKKRWVRVDGQ